MSWEIVLGLIALVGFVISISTLFGNLSKTLGVLETTIKNLRETIDEFKKNSQNTHAVLYKKCDEHDQKLADHEVRIEILEKKG